MFWKLHADLSLSELDGFEVFASLLWRPTLSVMKPEGVRCGSPRPVSVVFVVFFKTLCQMNVLGPDVFRTSSFSLCLSASLV